MPIPYHNHREPVEQSPVDRVDRAVRKLGGPLLLQSLLDWLYESGNLGEAMDCVEAANHGSVRTGRGMAILRDQLNNS